MSLLDFLNYRQAKRIDESQTAWQRYRELLQRFASGEEVDSVEADLILEEAGKTESDLQSDVALLEQRIQWAAQLESSSEAEADRAHAENEIYRMVAEVESLQAKFAGPMQNHRNRIAQCDSVMTAAAYARENLAGSILDPVLKSKTDSLNSELRLLQGDRREAEEGLRGCNLAYWRRTLEGAREQRKKLSQFDQISDRHWHAKCKEYSEGLKHAEERAERYEADIAATEKRITVIRAQLEECHARMLEA